LAGVYVDWLLAGVYVDWLLVGVYVDRLLAGVYIDWMLAGVYIDWLLAGSAWKCSTPILLAGSQHKRMTHTNCYISTHSSTFC